MQELEAETRKERCLLACFLCLLSYLSYTTQPHLTRDDTAHSGSDTPTSTSNEKSASQTWPREI